jgi:RimJ/RimL family protein N-acetyltransferase
MLGDRDYWSKGYGTDAMNTLLGYIFQHTPLTRVYLHTLDWNIRAHKSFQKAGFVPIRHIRRDGHSFLEMETYKEWRQKKMEQVQKESRQAGVSPPSQGERS